MRPIKLFRPHPAISRASQEDLPQLVALYEAVRDECGNRIPRAVLDDVLPQESDVRVWMLGGFELYKAELRGELAGVLRCTFPTGACVLDSLAVAFASRGQGVARALLERGVTRARRAGMNKVWLRALGETADSTSLYNALGFRETARLRAGGTVEQVVLELLL